MDLRQTAQNVFLVPRSCILQPLRSQWVRLWIYSSVLVKHSREYMKVSMRKPVTISILELGEQDLISLRCLPGWVWLQMICKDIASTIGTLAVDHQPYLSTSLHTSSQSWRTGRQLQHRQVRLSQRSLPSSWIWPFHRWDYQRVTSYRPAPWPSIWCWERGQLLPIYVL